LDHDDSSGGWRDFSFARGLSLVGEKGVPVKILLTLACLFATLFVVTAQSGPTREWYACTVAKVLKEGKVSTTYGRCPQLQKEKGISELRVVGLEVIPNVAGTKFFLRVAGRCLIAYTVGDHERERFIRHPLNIDCDKGRKLTQMLLPAKKEKG
jgi:hypothetical protein